MVDQTRGHGEFNRYRIRQRHSLSERELEMRYSVRSIFLATLFVAFFLASLGAIRRVLRLTPHEYAIDQVNGRDGWAREEEDGVVADLNGYTCPIGDKSLKELVGCQRLRKLTAYKTNVTDNGLIYLPNTRI